MRGKEREVASGFCVMEPLLLSLFPLLFYLYCHIFQCLENLSVLIDPWPIISAFSGYNLLFCYLLKPLFQCSPFLLHINLCPCLYPHLNKEQHTVNFFVDTILQSALGQQKDVHYLYDSHIRFHVNSY